MVVTDILTTWVEVIISVNWIVVFSLMFLVQFVWIDWSVLWCYWLSDSSGIVQSWLVGIRLVCSFLWLRIVTIYHKYSHEKMFRLGSILNYNKILLFLNCSIYLQLKLVCTSIHSWSMTIPALFYHSPGIGLHDFPKTYQQNKIIIKFHFMENSKKNY